MEIKNGIVINGVLHKLVSIHSDDYFINCGKVTDNFVYDDNAKEEEE